MSKEILILELLDKLNEDLEKIAIDWEGEKKYGLTREYVEDLREFILERCR